MMFLLDHFWCSLVYHPHLIQYYSKLLLHSCLSGRNLLELKILTVMELRILICLSIRLDFTGK